MRKLKRGDRLTKEYLGKLDALAAEASADMLTKSKLRTSPVSLPAEEPHLLVRGWFNPSSLIFRPQITYGCVSYFTSTGKNCIEEIGWNSKYNIPDVIGYGRTNASSDDSSYGLKEEYTFTNTTLSSSSSAATARLSLAGVTDIRIYVYLIISFEHSIDTSADSIEAALSVACSVMEGGISFEVGGNNARFDDYYYGDNEYYGVSFNSIWPIATLRIPDSSDDAYQEDSDGFVRMLCTQTAGCGDIRII